MKLLLLLVLVAAASAAPFIRFKRQAIPPESSCGGQCTGVHSKFNFQIGTSYQYKWESENIIETVGSDHGNSKVTQSALVTLTPESGCQFRIELSSVSIEFIVHSEWKEDLERNSLRFHFDDGVISNVCPEPNEPTWVLNFKRSILSALQNSHTSTSQSRMQVDEWDVSGKCPTDYTFTSLGGKETFQKSKNMNSCISPVESTRGLNYDLKSDYNSVPILNASQECTQEIEKQVFKTVACIETFDYAPMRSQGSAGVKTRNTVKISVIGEVADQSTVTPAGPSKSLLFEATHMGLEQALTAASEAKATLEDLCKTDDIRPTQASLFANLVHSLRKMTEAEISELVTSSNSACDLQKKLVQDAIPVCGSEMCVKYVVKTLKSNELTHNEKNQWFSSLAFVKRPTAQMIADVESLVDDEHVEGLLGISSMLHNFCKIDKDCAENSNFKSILSKFKSKLVDNCQRLTDKAQIHKFTVVIKAIGNIGRDPSIVDAGKECFETYAANQFQDVPLEVGGAMLNALRRMPCHKVRSIGLERIYEDPTMNLEMRIEAFVQRARCYCPEFKLSLERTYEEETSQQFGNFIFTYVKAKQSTADPTQKGEREFFSTINLDKKFNVDPTKSSAYLEMGKFDQEHNVGIQTQGALVADGTSLHTSANLNLTLQLFGTSWNVLEVGFRQQGLDKLFNDLFGPEGYFTKPEDWESKEGLSEFKLQGYLRVFGNELAYGGYEIEKGTKIPRLCPDLLTWSNCGSMWPKDEIDISKNIMFIDLNHQIPTLSGLPLVLAVDGTASNKIEHSVKMNSSRAAGLLLINRSIAPRLDANQYTSNFMIFSTSIEVSSTIAFEAAGARTGVKHVTRFHKSAAIETSFQFQGNTVKVKVILPKEKMELFDIQSDHFKLAAPTVFGIAGTKQKKCLGLGRALGIDLCSEVTKPTAGQNKPYGITLTMEKTDKNLNSYDFEFEMGPAGLPKRFLFNTAGSEADREVRFQYTMPTDQSLRVELRTPVKELLAEGELTPGEQGSQNANLKLTIDNREEYTMSASLTQLSDPSHQAPHGYELNIEAYGPGLKKPILVRSRLEALENKNAHWMSPYLIGFFVIERLGLADTVPLKAEITITGLYDKPIEFKLLDDPEDFSSMISWSTPNCKGDHKTKLKLVIDDTGSHQFEFGLATDYTNLKTTKKYNLQYDLKQDTVANVTGFQITQTQHFESNIFPDKYRDTRLEMEYSRIDHLRLKYDGTYDKDRKAWESYLELKDERQDSRKLWMKAMVKCVGFDAKFYADLQQETETDYKSLIRAEYFRDKLELVTNVTIKPGPGEYKYLIHSILTANDDKSDRLIFHTETYAVGKSKVFESYIHTVKSRWIIFYDVHLETTHETVDKDHLWLFFKSDLLAELLNTTDDRIDLKLSGNRERRSDSFLTYARLEISGADYASITVIEPRPNSKEYSVDLEWDLENSPKQIKFEYNQFISISEEFTIVKHDVKVLTKLTNEYEYDASAQFGPELIFKETCLKNKAKLMENSLMIKNDFPNEFEVDAVFQTFEPWSVRHQTGSLVLRNKVLGQKEGIEQLARLELKCHTSNQRLLFETIYLTEDDSFRNGELKLELGPYKMHNNVRYIVKEEKINGTTIYTNQVIHTGSMEWGPKKVISNRIMGLMVVDYDYAKYFPITDLKFEHEIETPFESMTHLEYGAGMKHKPSDKRATGKVYLEHNELRMLDFDILLFQPKESDDGVSLEGEAKIVTRGRLKDAKLTFKHSEIYFNEIGNKTQQFELGLEWNSDNQLSAKYNLEQNAGIENRLLDFIAKVPGRNWDSQAKLETHYDQPDQKLNAGFVMNILHEKYEISLDFDGRTETGTAQIRTPYDSLQNAELEIKKIAPNKYEISTAQNGEQGIKLAGIVSLGEHKRKLGLETQDTENPFAIVVENTNMRNKMRLKIQVIEAPSSATEKIWGIDYMMSNDGRGDVMGDEQTGHLKLRVGHRYFEDQYKINRRTGSLEISTKMHASDNPDIKASEFVLDRKVNEELTLIFVQLDDPHLQNVKEMSVHLKNKLFQPIILAVNAVQKSGEQYTALVTANLDYTGDTKDMVTAKLDHQSSRSPSPHGCLYCLNSKNEVSLEQPSSNLYHKISFERKVEEPMKHILTRGYKDKEGEMKEWVLNFNVFKSFSKSRVFEAELKAPEHTYTVEGIIEKNRAGKAFVAYVFAKRDEVDSMYMELAIDDAPLPNVDFEIRTSEKSDVLLHASMRSQGKDSVALTLWHSEKGKRIDDIIVTISLIKPYRINYKVYCRPGLHREIQHAAEEGIEELKKKNIDADGLDMPKFVTDLGERTEPMYNNWAAEQQKFSAEVSPGMKKIGDQLSDYSEMVADIVKSIGEVVEQAWDELVASMPENKFADSVDKAKDKIQEIGENLLELLEPVKEFWEQLKEIVRSASEKAKEMSKNAVDYWKDSELNKKASELWKGFTESKVVKQIHEWSKQFGFTELQMKSMKDEIKQAFRKWWKEMAEHLPQIKESNPEEGRYEAEMPIPYSVNSFDGLVNKIGSPPDALKPAIGFIGGKHWLEILEEQSTDDDDDEEYLLF